MAEDTVNIQIGKDLIAPLVESKIKAAMVEALGSSGDLIETVVHKILYDKVNEKGGHSSYSSENKFNYIDVVLRQTVTTTLREAIKEWIEENQKTIRDSLRQQLEKKSTRDAMAKAMLSGFVGATKNSWAFNVKFAFQTPEDAKANSGADVPF